MQFPRLFVAGWSRNVIVRSLLNCRNSYKLHEMSHRNISFRTFIFSIYFKREHISWYSWYHLLNFSKYSNIHRSYYACDQIFRCYVCYLLCHVFCFKFELCLCTNILWYLFWKRDEVFYGRPIDLFYIWLEGITWMLFLNTCIRCYCLN